MSSTIEITKTCEWCSNTFIARKCTTRYCSKRCAKHAYKDAKRKERVAKEQTKASQPRDVDESPFYRAINKDERGYYFKSWRTI